MTLNELNMIERILDENCKEKIRARKSFDLPKPREFFETPEMYKCYLDELKIKERTLNKEYEDAYKAYNAFIKHNWQ